jgi:hypothetical protein
MSGAFQRFSTVTFPTSVSWLVGNESGLFVKLAYCSAIASMIAYGIALRYHRARLAKLDAIPTVGPSGLLSSYWGALKFFVYARDIVEEGYVRVKLTTTKIVLSQIYWGLSHSSVSRQSIQDTTGQQMAHRCQREENGRGYQKSAR